MKASRLNSSLLPPLFSNFSTENESSRKKKRYANTHPPYIKSNKDKMFFVSFVQVHFASAGINPCAWMSPQKGSVNQHPCRKFLSASVSAKTDVSGVAICRRVPPSFWSELFWSELGPSYYFWGVALHEWGTLCRILALMVSNAVFRRLLELSRATSKEKEGHSRRWFIHPVPPTFCRCDSVACPALAQSLATVGRLKTTSEHACCINYFIDRTDGMIRRSVPMRGTRPLRYFTTTLNLRRNKSTAIMRPPVAASVVPTGKSTNKKKCRHGYTAYICRRCPGAGICKHNKQRYRCVLCGGQGICRHGRRRRCCILCKGRGICPHGNDVYYCKKCQPPGQGICVHMRVRSRCVPCGGGSICRHRRVRYVCPVCSPLGCLAFSLRSHYRSAFKHFMQGKRSGKALTMLHGGDISIGRRRRGSSSSSAILLLGCSIEKLYEHLQRQFQPKMSFKNYGGPSAAVQSPQPHKKRKIYWHIDHRRPVASFDLANWRHMRMCFHYTNLRPMWARENQRKHATYDVKTFTHRWVNQKVGWVVKSRSSPPCLGSSRFRLLLACVVPLSKRRRERDDRNEQKEEAAQGNRRRKRDSQHEEEADNPSQERNANSAPALK